MTLLARFHDWIDRHVSSPPPLTDDEAKALLYGRDLYPLSTVGKAVTVRAPQVTHYGWHGRHPGTAITEFGGGDWLDRCNARHPSRELTCELREPHDEHQRVIRGEAIRWRDA